MKNTAAGNHLDILIVEDSPTQAEELRYILEKKDYRVSLAANGREALDFLENRIPDIVVTDILMPEMSGYELCKQIRGDEKLRELPVILVTSLSEPTDVIKGLEAGANNFITKPYDEKYIISRIEYLVANMELREDSETEDGTKVFFSGQQYLITAERMQILDLLLSTYEKAHHQNHELLSMQKELRESNKRLAEEKAKTESIIAAIGDGISIQDRDLTIVYQNDMLISYFGDHRGEKCHQAYNESVTPCVPCPVLASFEDGVIRTTEMIRPTRKGVSSFEVTTSPLRDAAGDIIACIEVARNVDQRKKLEQERENLIQDLQEALASIKTMSGLIPICAGCKKIRVDSGFWQQIEAYISEHSDAVFSHGICPECAVRLYPEVFGDADEKSKKSKQKGSSKTE
jgi:DNA-binding response OmpR family regulator